MSSSTYSTGTVASSGATLAAVNEILSVIGEPPVTALDTGNTSDEAEAETYLDRYKKRILARGWFSNRLINKEYTRDGSNQYVMTNVLSFQHASVSSAAGTFGVGSGSNLKLTLRSGLLYDMENDQNTFANNSTLRLDTIMDIAFSQLPEKLRTYIVKTAAYHFERYKKRGVIDRQLNEQDLLEAKVQAEQEDQDFSRTNVLLTPGAIAMGGGRRFNRAIR